MDKCMMDAQMIFSIFQAAKTSEGESKLKFFTPEINSILLEWVVQQHRQSKFHFDNYCLKPGAHWKPFETLITCKMTRQQLECYRLHLFKSTCCSDLGCSLIKGTLWSVFERKELFLNSVFLTETKLILNLHCLHPCLLACRLFLFLLF